MLVGLLLAAVAITAGALTQSQLRGDTFAPVVDSEAYLLQGLRVAAGHDIVEGVYFQAPLYPLLLGLALRLAGVPGALLAEHIEDLLPGTLGEATAVGRGLNFLAGLVLVWLLWRLGCRLFGRATGFWAAFLAAIYGPFLFYQAHLLKVSLSLVFLPWAVLAVVRARELERPRGYVWVGLALGLGSLVRGNMQLLLMVGGAALLWEGWRGGALRVAALRIAWLGAGFALALAPVTFRNSLAAGYPVFSTAAGGTAFYLCNNGGNSTGLVQALAMNRQVPRHEFGDWEQGAEEALGRGLSPSEISNYWFDQALDDIAADPDRWLLAEARKLGLLFSRYEAPDNTMVSLGEEESWLLASTPSRWSVVLPLAFGGAWLAWRRRRAERLPGDPARVGRAALVLALVGYGGSLLLFNMSSRFRMPMAPLTMVLSGYFLASLPGLLRHDAPRRLLLGALLAVAGGVTASCVSEGPLGPLDPAELATHKAVRYKNRAQVAAGRGDYDKAREDLQRALTVAGDAGQVSPDLFVLGASWDRQESLGAADRGELEESEFLRGRAVFAIQQALVIRADHGPAQRMAGLLLYDEGAHRDAVALFAGALAELPRDREARQYQVLSLLALGRHEDARVGAALLVEHDGDRDDGFGLLAVALWGLGKQDAARDALEQYDRLATMREHAGLLRRLPELSTFRELRLELQTP
ncbi:MAG: tetratricopeptide (TPR) repeat protein [Pseudohongiellaceae bacterium]|jgi:tetratricopeptide (TPR) repeat protein